ncbi:MAG: hypothetical protein PWQ77_1136 [Kosmotogales bacterium]|nr:hypothetical protein [Kosmotogales bacterium]
MKKLSLILLSLVLVFSFVFATQDINYDRSQDVDIVYLTNGDILKGEITTESFSIRTSYAHITIPTENIAYMSVEGQMMNMETIVAINGSRFSGFIDEQTITLKITSGYSIPIRREKISHISFQIREDEEGKIENTQFIKLKNGNYFTGTVQNPDIVVATTYADIPVSLNEVESIKLIGGENPLTKILMKNEDTIQGILETEDIEIVLDIGPTVKVYKDRIDEIYLEKGYLPQGITIGGTYYPKINVGNIDSDKYVFVQGGTFRMGSASGNDDEKPVHQVTLDYNFIIGKYEVTFDEYDEYCSETGKSKPDDFGWGRGKRPVIYVSWYDAIEYCNWLSENENLPAAYDENGKFLDANGDITYDITEVVGYRLPTEAEWEYATRGGSETQNYEYSGSNDIDEVAWYDGNSENKTHEVGTKAANELGIFDMSGNAHEWCSDWYGNYSNTEELNPVGPTSGPYRVRRGGSWFDGTSYCRVADHSYCLPTPGNINQSFRVCRTARPYDNSRPTIKKISDPFDVIRENEKIFEWRGKNLDGTVISYEYKKDNEQWQTTTNTQYKWNFITEGSHTFKVRAKDDDGLYSNIITWSFTYKNGPIPVPEVVFVQGGSFRMGSTSGGDNEKPVHKVTLDYNFMMGKYEVTFERYDEYCGETGKGKPDDLGLGRGKSPVINVSWYNAIEYCNWLSENENLPVAYDKNGKLLDVYGNITSDITEVIGYRLPTEAEWEYAARGGSKTQNYEYSGSDDIDEVAWYVSNSGDKTHEVGTKAPNELGIFDMSGNVWEWCSDWYENYSDTEELNPVGPGPTSGSYRVQRGGGWYGGASSCRVADRDNCTPTVSLYYFGFRICRTASSYDNSRPTIEKISGPFDVTRENEKIFEWRGKNLDGTVINYEYKKDNEQWQTTTGTQYKWNLTTEGSHTFKVRTKNDDGAYSDIITWSFIYKDDPIPMPEVVFVQGGTFRMGSTSGDDDEKPAHKVILDYNFMMGKYEVTFDEYDEYCSETGKSKPDDEGLGRGKRPVINVSWYDAIKYCNWLSENENLPAAYNENGKFLDMYGDITYDITEVAGYRLPTEAEWEYAARGGNETQNNEYSGSNDIDEVAWYDGNSGNRTHEVGTKKPNGLGIFDMSGNVWEWCSGWHENYSNTEELNPVGFSGGSGCVFRGGSWGFNGNHCRVAYRGHSLPSNSGNCLGFRVCRPDTID